jgi:lactate permease
MFGGMHVQVATTLNLNPITVFAGQNSGAAIGNMICPNNVVSASTTVNMPGREGEIIKRVFPGFLTLFVLYGLLSILYTMVIFA